jgi:transposase, IS5 family
LIEPVYLKPIGAGRPPIELVKMLRIYFLQQWYDLSDPGVEEALYDSVSMRRFVGIDLGAEAVPDETTICKFRHLLEEHHLGDKMFAAVNAHLAASGLRVSRGTMVDATIISAPSSTKNRDKARDEEMRQTKKGNQWYFGMKAHIGADTKTKLIHSVVASAANVHDSVALSNLLHGEETRVYGDKAYAGQGHTIQASAPNAKDFTHRKAYRHRSLSEAEERANHHKSKVRSKIEHIFFVIKRQFKFIKVRYRGLRKNAHRLFVLCGLTNLFLARRHLLRLQD